MGGDSSNKGCSGRKKQQTREIFPGNTRYFKDIEQIPQNSENKTRGLYSEGLIFGGTLRFKIDWASPVVWSKFTVFALFYFVFEGNFQVQAPRGAYIWRGDLTGVFLRYEFGGLIFGGAYTWKGLCSEFYGIHFDP